ncbi:MAG: lipoyl(octanoyl) transferase LipB [Bacteroidetes bacterium]|nr:lipoyl(octanoyl) transferase LipB [Bacteroidota bacterium]MBS1630262.1 lipoyl(octanoyl) transferase LipB [Bacteroidota bacterium]
MRQRIEIMDWGLVEYGEAWQRQEAFLATQLQLKRDWNLADASTRTPQPPTQHRLFLCGHPPVYTLGKSGLMEHLLLNDARLNQLGVSFYKTNRGGDITYHGPGQIVGYPMLDLEKFFTDLGRYMRSLEEVIIRTLAPYGIVAGRLPGATGVWLEPENPGRARKICAMGVRCSRWLTMHGFALNANTDLSYFSHIVPCGISDKGVSSIQQELGREVDEAELKQRLIQEFLQVFEAESA